MKKKRINLTEEIAKVVFMLCGAVAIFAICSITLYLMAKGIPALKEVGVIQLIFNQFLSYYKR